MEERKEAEAFLKQAEFQPGLLPARILMNRKKMQDWMKDWKKKPKKTVEYMDVSKNNGTPKSSIGFSIINHPFWVPLFLETPIYS